MNQISPENFSSRKIRILLIDDNSPFTLPLQRSFSGHKNIHVDLLLSSDKRAKQFRYSRFLGKIKQINHLREENIETVLRETVSSFRSDLVIPTREWISILLFNHKTELEKFVKLHPLPAASTLEITGNKRNLNKWLNRNGFPSAHTSETVNGWSGNYPVLLKPVFGIGGKGILTVDNPDTLQNLLNNDNRYEKDFFLQEYIEGYDIDASLFAVDGKIIYHTIQRGLISAEMTFYKGVEFVKNEDLFNQVSGIIDKLNYTGIAHLDFRYSTLKKQNILIDFNSRYWSSMQGSRAKGVNFPYLVVAWIFSQKAEVIDYRTGYYYFSTTALQLKLKNLFINSGYPVKLKDTQLCFIYKDPLPEIMFLLSKIGKTLKRKRKFRTKPLVRSYTVRSDSQFN